MVLPNIRKRAENQNGLNSTVKNAIHSMGVNVLSIPKSSPTLTSTKRSRCFYCSRKEDKKVQVTCYICNRFICEKHRTVEKNIVCAQHICKVVNKKIN